MSTTRTYSGFNNYWFFGNTLKINIFTFKFSAIKIQRFTKKYYLFHYYSSLFCFFPNNPRTKCVCLIDVRRKFYKFKKRKSFKQKTRNKINKIFYEAWSIFYNFNCL